MTALHLDAGKYAAFLWPAYAVTVVAFAWMIAATLLRARRWRREVERLEAARPRKGGTDGAGDSAGNGAA